MEDAAISLSFTPFRSCFADHTGSSAAVAGGSERLCARRLPRWGRQLMSRLVPTLVPTLVLTLVKLWCADEATCAKMGAMNG